MKPTKIVPNFTSVSTTLMPALYGKKETHASNLKLQATIQLFKPAKPLYRLFATLANNGTVSFFHLNLMYVSNSQTNSATLGQRPVFLSTALDPKKYVTRQNRTMYNDSNAQMIKVLNSAESPFNSVMANVNMGTLHIPFTNNSKDNKELEWDNQKHNMHCLKLASQLHTIAESNTTDSVKQDMFTKAWNEYQAVENMLLESGIIVVNNALIAVDNGVVPTLSVHQESSSPNQFLDSKTLFGNENSKASYCPILNTVSGVLDISNNEMDSKADFSYGLHVMNQRNQNGSNQTTDDSDSNTQSNGNNGLKRFSTEAYCYDFLNNRAEDPVRIILTDSANVARAEKFAKFCKENTSVQITNAQLSLGFALGGFTSRFSLDGNNINYTSYKKSSTDNLEDISNIDLNAPVVMSTDDNEYVLDESLVMSVDNSMVDHVKPKQQFNTQSDVDLSIEF